MNEHQQIEWKLSWRDEYLKLRLIEGKYLKRAAVLLFHPGTRNDLSPARS